MYASAFYASSVQLGARLDHSLDIYVRHSYLYHMSLLSPIKARGTTR